MSIEDTQKYYAQSEEFTFKSISCDVGVAIEIGYERQSINYSIMRSDPVVAKYFEIYEDHLAILEQAKKILNPNMEQVQRIVDTQKEIGQRYKDFIIVLTEALRMWEAEQTL